MREDLTCTFLTRYWYHSLIPLPATPKKQKIHVFSETSEIDFCHTHSSSIDQPHFGENNLNVRSTGTAIQYPQSHRPGRLIMSFVGLQLMYINYI
jgi:hypothetical protein